MGRPEWEWDGFELAKGSTNITVLVNFDTPVFIYGVNPAPGVVIDSSGNLYGMTSYGGTYGSGVIYELAKGSSTPTTLASLIYGIEPGTTFEGGLTMDSEGNLYGTAEGGGDTDGSIFELAKGATAITTLAVLDSDGDAGAFGDLLVDSSGNIFGTAGTDGGYPYGNIFEIASGSSTLTIFAALPDDGSDGAYPMSGLIEDSNGDLFGTASQGGGFNDGTVFELLRGATSVTVLANLVGQNETYPVGDLTFDENGNIWGATSGLNEGVIKDGGVFELKPSHLSFVQQPVNQASTGTITPSISVEEVDADGNVIIGTPLLISLGIESGPAGAVLSGVVPVNTDNGVATFSTASLSTQGTYTLEGEDDLYYAPAVVSNSFTAGAPQVSDVTADGTAWSSTFVNYLSTLNSANVNGYSIPVGSSAQLAPLPWKNLNQINITFTQNVTVGESALQLVGVNVASYSFSGFSYNSSTDTATWTLTAPIGDDKLLIDLNGASVTNSGGIELDGDWADGVSSYPSGDGSPGSNFLFSFDVLPGDVNQSGAVNILDAAATLNTDGTSTTTAGYSIFMDVTGSGAINILDAVQVLDLAGTSLPAGTPMAPAVVVQASSSGLVSSDADPMDSVLDKRRRGHR
jgi:uncharacterized repeat protein (TIGR03803 family)